jgi:nucleoside-triphosphatase THEP1
MTEGDPVMLISIIMLVYILFGMIGAVLGYLGGLKARTMAAVAGPEIFTDNESSFFRQTKEIKSSPWFLLYHLFCMVICLYIINSLPIWLSLLPSLGYATFCLIWYRGSMRSFRKPSFWIWFMSITLLAAVFWNGLSKGEIWDMEGLIIGLKMNLRAIVILTGFAAMSRELRNPVIRTVLYHHGFANVYHSISLAFSVLPGIIDTLPGVKMIIRKPVSSLGMIIRRAIDVYPALKKELAEQTPLIIITGEIQQGKTTYLANIVTSLREKGFRMNGIIARGVHDANGRIGYDLEDINTGEKHIYIRNVYTPGWFRYGKYYFSPEGLEFGKYILQNITEENTDLIVIDEIGPVEIKGRGWADDIERLVSTSQIPQLWVVRRSLLKRAIRQWNVGEVLVIDISKETVENIIDEIFVLMLRSGK